MEQDSLQVMLSGSHLTGIKVECSQAGIRILKIKSDFNDNYAIIDLILDQNLAAGEYDLICSNKYGRVSVKYPLNGRTLPGVTRALTAGT
jgi:hypothetical protein